MVLIINELREFRKNKSNHLCYIIIFCYETRAVKQRTWGAGAWLLQRYKMGVGLQKNVIQFWYITYLFNINIPYVKLSMMTVNAYSKSLQRRSNSYR